MSVGPILGPPDLFRQREVLGFGSDALCVRKIPKDDADALIRRGHYSGSVVWSSNVHLGVYLDGKRIGALQFGPPMNPASAEKVVPGEACLELSRLWLEDEKPSNTTSRVISYAVKFLRMTRPDVTWIQSYADSRCGKAGGIYQACSFDYFGSHETTFYLLDGEWFHQSMLKRPPVDKRGWGSGPKMARLRGREHEAEAHTFKQYRYIRFLRPRARRVCTLTRCAYPKVTE